MRAQGRAKGQSSMAMQRGSDHGASDPLQMKAGQGSVGCAVSPGLIPRSIPVDISLGHQYTVYNGCGTAATKQFQSHQS